MNYAKTTLLLAGLTAVFMSLGFMMGGVGGMLIAFLFAIGTNAYAFWNSDKMALRMHNAAPATKASQPELYEMVERLADKAGLPMPAVYIINTDQPNAFATGRNPENAAVAATTGIMRALSYDELEGVMAHELAHIQNRDTLIMTVAATVAGAISMVAHWGMWFGRGRGQNGGWIGMLLAAMLAPFAAMMIQMLISRTREYAADRRAAEISGNPGALASALEKIGGLAGRVEMESAERNPASAHLFIVNPLSGARMDNLFSTHPSMKNRIAALMEFAETQSAPQTRSRIPTVRRR